MQVAIDLLSFIVGILVGLVFWLIWDWYKLRREMKKKQEANK
jgi:uncharacterized integral membrane protein